jgi:hypothetical protein
MAAVAGSVLVTAANGTRAPAPAAERDQSESHQVSPPFESGLGPSRAGCPHESHREFLRVARDLVVTDPGPVAHRLGASVRSWTTGLGSGQVG